MIPPGAGLLLCPGEPVIRAHRELRIGEESGLGISRRIDDALDVAVRTQDELAIAAQHLRR